MLHGQLMTYFRERILDGRLSVGTRLPTDEELAALYQISRDSVRQALALLASEGLIERVQGRGTFVSQPPSNDSPVTQVKQKQIGLVLNRTPRTQLTMDLLVGVEQAAKSHGYNVSFTYTEGEQEQQARDIARLRANNVLGMIIWAMGDTTYDASIQQLQADHIPFVLMDRYFPGLAIDYVGSDNAGGGYRATEHLLILGHRRIGFVFAREETLQTTSVYERWQGYCKALQKYEVPYDETLVVPDFRQLQTGTHEGLVEFLQRPDRPSAIFAVNDYVALDVLQAAKALHLRIPEDLAVVGFDDMEFAAHVHPPLTTVVQQFIDIGLRAGTLLINRIEGIVGVPKHIELPTNLIIRESCGAQLHVKKILSLP
ncbi:MAG TPA: GntR family transcriptional regulator [Ktedonobacteraceae bacterium]|nr:GntR family transcriptional regulator [Ktedonobacteraceae bacterium]